MIEVRKLSKVYDSAAESLRVLDGLDLDVGEGEMVAVTGPSGSGKTTLLNMLGALDRPSEGTVAVGGRDIGGLDEPAAAEFRNRTLGFVFQQHHLLPQLDVLENVLVPRLAGGWQEPAEETTARARDLLERVGLGGRLGHRPWQLSGGEKLRVAVARALVNRPRVVLADEPTGSLDVEATARVAELLLRLNLEERVTLVVVTHNLGFAARLGRVLRLDHGRLEEVAG